MKLNIKQNLLSLNHALLFLCVSIYLGTGWSLWLFSFPIAPQLTVSNYYLQFVPQVTAATQFFTYVTIAMFFCSIVMIVAEWRSVLRWLPIGVLLAIIAATTLTETALLPLNEAMSKGITDPAQLHDILTRWMFLNKIRISLWTVDWLCMMAYYAVKARAAGDRP